MSLIPTELFRSIWMDSDVIGNGYITGWNGDDDDDRPSMDMEMLREADGGTIEEDVDGQFWFIMTSR